jgi:hypothetical protein
MPDYTCPDKMGFLWFTEDGRVLYLLPWENSSLAGTTDAKARAMPSTAPAVSNNHPLPLSATHSTQGRPLPRRQHPAANLLSSHLPLVPPSYPP